ncbi:hypothetical protein CSUB01_09930 [Colletotrichum sublineola]|uniref:Uncharacterized protein n=1 Tax=Colletotrichum sublineola TaxID=1173701 RepID=A0A066X7C0_COLSU|nr:hypothetical protein CSUB01_09930 [Colletotrichum sublineola]
MKPDPDIAGKGVIVAFTVTAMITLLLAIFCLVVGRTHEGRQSFNPIDRYARKYISEPTRRLMFRVGMNPDLQSLVAYDLVNTFSDLQLVTGLAVLVGGIKELADSRISTYHFMIVTDLAWFCTLTHLLSLVVTRSMRDSVKRTHPQRYHHENTQMAARLARALRLCFMAANFVLLNYAIWVTGYEELFKPGQYRCPIKCVVNERKGGDPWVMMIYNMVILSYYYVVQMFLSWRTGRLFWMDHIRKYLIDKKGQPVNVLSPETVFRRWIENKLLKGLKMCFLAVWYFLASEVETLLGLTAIFGIGVYSLVQDRNRGQMEMRDEPGPLNSEENELVFSQLVPIFLLIIPFMGLFESYARHSKALGELNAKELESCPSEP